MTHSPNLRARVLASAAALLAAMSPPLHAQDATRIVAATVYPDSASVERALTVPGGTRHIAIACMPASVDVSTLQVVGDAELRVGDIRATPLPATRGDECAPSATETRRKDLAVQRAALEAQRDSTELALAYLKQWGAQPHADAAETAHATAATTNRPGATASDLRHAALDLLTDQARIKRDLDALERTEAKLADEAPAARGKDGWRTVRFDVWTPAPASLRVRYGVANTYWRPTYRASVDIARASVRIDRQADVVQASGEDWTDVKVKLSTGRVNRVAEAATPQSWWIDLVTERARDRVVGETAMPIAAAPARRAYAPQGVELLASSVKRLDVVPPPWGVDVARGDYATEFDIAQPVSLASDGETHTLAIATQSLPVTLLRRTTPRNDRAVYLLAQAERPAGVWPAGPLQSLRDGTLVGRTQWQPSTGDKLTIPLGQDDQMHVDIESPGAFTAAKGVFGGGVEKTSAAIYAIVNQRPDAVTVEVLDAAPVSRNEAITVTHKYEPRPTTDAWNKVPGVAAWTLAIAPLQTQRVSVTHAVDYPKDDLVSNLP